MPSFCNAPPISSGLPINWSASPITVPTSVSASSSSLMARPVSNLLLLNNTEQRIHRQDIPCGDVLPVYPLFCVIPESLARKVLPVGHSRAHWDGTHRR